MKNRNIKYWTAGATLLAVLVFAYPGYNAEAKSSQEIQDYSLSDMAMGTLVSETIYTDGDDLTKDIMELLKSVEEQYLSWRVEDSDIAKMNAAAESGETVTISDETAAYLKQTLQLAKDSDGVLDPTIGKITRLWDIDGDNPKVPKAADLQMLLEDTGYQKIQVAGNQVTMGTDSSIDLGAVGKGIGCDEAVNMLQKHEEVQGAVISVGGSIATYGSKPDESPWKVAITDPQNDGAYLGALTLNGACFVSTSGDYEKYFVQDGVKYHHIMNPATGYPAESGLSSVTIITDNGLNGDGLSTACFVLGMEKSLALLEQYDADAIFVDQDKNVYLTEGAEALFELTQEGYQICELEE